MEHALRARESKSVVEFLMEMCSQDDTIQVANESNRSRRIDGSWSKDPPLLIIRKEARYPPREWVAYKYLSLHGDVHETVNQHGNLVGTETSRHSVHISVY